MPRGQSHWHYLLKIPQFNSPIVVFRLLLISILYLRVQSSNEHNEVNNSSYTELEREVAKVAFHLEYLASHWSKLEMTASSEVLKSAVEFQSFLNAANSAHALAQLAQTLFQLNWLLTSKSGFGEPNWQASVLSLTPATRDSFVGVNLLKSYYRYVRYWNLVIASYYDFPCVFFSVILLAAYFRLVTVY